jgi:hypothetical protein
MTQKQARNEDEDEDENADAPKKTAPSEARSSPARTSPQSLYADDLAALRQGLLGVLAYVVYAFCSLPWCRLGQHLAGHFLADGFGGLVLLCPLFLVVLMLRGRLLVGCFIVGSCMAVGFNPALGLTSLREKRHSGLLA